MIRSNLKRMYSTCSGRTIMASPEYLVADTALKYRWGGEQRCSLDKSNQIQYISYLYIIQSYNCLNHYFWHAHIVKRQTNLLDVHTFLFIPNSDGQ